MLKEARVMAFVSVTDRAKAREFYGGTLGLTLTEDEQTALVFDAGGTMLRVSLVEKLTPQPFTVLGWDVSDISATMTELRGRGVAFESFPFLPEDAGGVMTFPDGTRVAWFKDPDGNLLSLSQFSA